MTWRAPAYALRVFLKRYSDPSFLSSIIGMLREYVVFQSSLSALQRNAASLWQLKLSSCDHYVCLNMRGGMWSTA